MKKPITFLLFLFVSSFVFAQQDTTTVYSSPGYAKDPVRNKWKKTVEQKGGLWVVSFFNRKDVLQEKISFVDQKLEVRKGDYSYYENGVLKEEGTYDRGYKMGEWTSYYPNKQLHEKINYAWGKLYGADKAYWDTGQLKAHKNYVSDKKVGELKLFYKEGKLAAKEYYNESGELAKGEYFDQQGKAVDKLYVMQPPSYPGGLQAFDQLMSKEIRYPANAYQNKIEGIVKLEFTVLKNGKADHIVVKESPNAELSREAIRVLNDTKGWVPAMELGEAIDARDVVPIKFAINR